MMMLLAGQLRQGHWGLAHASTPAYNPYEDTTLSAPKTRPSGAQVHKITG